jgi:hypothetical protein
LGHASSRHKTDFRRSGADLLCKALSAHLQRKMMTIPFERTRALVQTKQFLEAMLDPKETPRVPRWMRGRAKALLRHYPGLCEIEMAHKALPEEFGPVPTFSRLSGTADVLGVIDASTAGERE